VVCDTAPCCRPIVIDWMRFAASRVKTIFLPAPPSGVGNPVDLAETVPVERHLVSNRSRISSSLPVIESRTRRPGR